MKIVFLLRFYPEYGGGETATRVLAEEFAALGYEVTVGYLWEKVIVGNIDYKICKIANTCSPVGKDEIAKSDYEIIKESLIQLFMERQPDVIINQWLPIELVQASRQNNTAVITCRHAAIHVHSPKWELLHRVLGDADKIILRMYYRNVYKYSSKWVLLCKKFAEEAVEIFGGDKKDKIRYIYNPCRYNEKTAIEPLKENIAICVGRVYAEKRTDLLLKIWSQIKTTGWRLVIIGDGPDLEKCKKLCEELDCVNVDFTGYLDPIEFYANAKIMLSASETEGFPMTLVEGMHFGVVPIVMGTYSSVYDVIPDGCGIITRDDEKDYREALEKLINDEYSIREMSRKAQISTERFQIEKIIKMWTELFKEMKLE